MTPNCQSISDCKHYLALFNGLHKTERKGNRYSSMTQKAYPHKIMSINQQKIITKPRNCILTLPGQIFDMEAIFSDQ